jgi:hypothetical protein
MNGVFYVGSVPKGTKFRVQLSSVQSLLERPVKTVLNDLNLSFYVYVLAAQLCRVMCPSSWERRLGAPGE